MPDKEDDPGMDVTSDEEWLRRIRRVLDADGEDGTLEIVFQPIVDVWTGAPTAYEALARFGEGGNPESWFLAAARVGLSTDLEVLCCKRALAYLSWIPKNISLSLNVSEHVLVERNALGFPNLPRDEVNRIIVEITEHAPIEDYPSLVEACAQLRQQGVRISIDDMGAGNSTFRHVINLSPDALKMDRYFTQGLDKRENDDRRALMIAMTAFCARVGVRLIVEGVETEDEAHALRAVGIRWVQGYLYGRPAELVQEAV